MKKLTKEQQQLLKQFQAGRRIAIYNGHHASGGEYRFTDNLELCRYRTFHNLMAAIYGFAVRLTPEQAANYWA
jgi:hypothetical protein